MKIKEVDHQIEVNGDQENTIEEMMIKKIKEEEREEKNHKKTQ